MNSSVIICSSVAQSCPILCYPVDSSTPGFLLKLTSIESVMPSDHLILCHPLLLLLSILPTIRVFSNESVLPIRWPKYWSFSFTISPSSEYSGLIFFSIDWFDVAVQGTLKSLSNTTVQKHQFFSAQLLYGPTFTSIHTYWENHSFNKMGLCLQSNVSFLICCLGWS